MSIRNDIPELIKAGVISQETAIRIEAFYKNRRDSSPNKLLVVFGILGAILVGLGIILMIAHNWDEFSRTTKTILAFFPLVTAHIVCGFVLLKKLDNTAWRESAATFLVFAIGACISLISQIYNISGNLSTFFLTWMLLCLPLIYVIKSSVTALFYVIGLTYYAITIGYFAYPSWPPNIYILLILAVLPHYYFLFKNRPKSNFLTLQNWLIPLSLTIVLGSFTYGSEELIFIAYFSLFGLFYMIGNNQFFNKQTLRNNAYKVIASLGTLILLFISSFEGYWAKVKYSEFEFLEILTTPEFFAAAGISLFAMIYLYLQQKNKPIKHIPPFSIIFILYILCFIIGLFSSISFILINLIIFSISILTIIQGVKEENFGILNLGLSIMTTLIICRFLDSDLSFIIRGLLLMIIGIGFFAANYWMLKKRKRDA